MPHEVSRTPHFLSPFPNAEEPAIQELLENRLAISASDAAVRIRALALTDKQGVLLDERLSAINPDDGRPVLICSLAQELDGFTDFILAHVASRIAAGLAMAAKICMDCEILIYAETEAQAEMLAAPLREIAPASLISVKYGPASPVLREETALYNAIDNGVIRCDLWVKSFSAEGWQGRPTFLLDVETAYWIYEGVSSSRRQEKLIMITTDERTRVVAVALGTPVSALLEELELAPAKPLLLGGMLGHFASAPALTSEFISYDSVYDSIRIFTDKHCMATIAKGLLSAAAETSCGKCVICREGSWQLKAVFTDVTEGRAKKEDLDLVTDIGELIGAGSFCAFGRNMVGPALSAVACSRLDLEAHIVRKTCPASVCTHFLAYVIDPKLCSGCGECLDVCPENAIQGKSGYIHMIDPAICEKCGRCTEVCEENAIVTASGRIRVPKQLTRVGRFK
ncbi:NADH-ubiquinone oxidoreductase-F iron-sulfur binding region domain-containing protein [Paenibacillus sp. FSL R7-0048]|jgi:ferredoxin|uniref:NADH-ubiquinone oxidoreductase-F iron-sulfur binding region domain-containing protein n=1 Tax=Paenibacillus TaxID=44249 RepID=UPI00096D684C|nr:NADH-ubiquinone oxidoreductase-F iron-sulfur binding region domain-containing protein [Paenibacillus odorifer]OMD79744.1 hypothetical protein BSK50_06020 [Paenibacillus odorifer]OMD79983.1 hypothetical protein BSK53_21185 [Paenibacillus odorifer]OMD98614.1 hypothetical protein BSK64_27310 [Paenibacillus odorifer]